MNLHSRMECGGILILVAALLALGTAQEAKFSGFLGCRFSKAVCQLNEKCIDDNLFGSCQKVDGPQDTYQYRLDRGTVHLLEKEIKRLVEVGYSWTSLYTQCKVGNILLAFRLGVQPDGYWCDEGGAPPARYQEALTDDSKAILADYINDYYSDQQPALEDALSAEDVVDVDPYGIPEKKDEFVTVHKYFADKREDDDAIYDQPNDDVFLQGYEPEGVDEGLGDNLNSLVDDLRPSDLLLLKSYLQGMDRAEERREEMMEPAGETPEVTMDTLEERPLEEGEENRGYVWDDRDVTQDTPMTPSEVMSDYEAAEMGGPPLEREDMTEGGEQPQLDEDVPSLSPPDAKLLGDLLQDKVDVDTLSDDQIQRLLNHVDNMLYDLEDMKSADQQGANGQLSAAGDDVIQPDMENEKRAEDPIPIEVDSVEVTEALPDPHDHAFDEPAPNPHTEAPKLTMLNTLQGYMHVSPAIHDDAEGEQFLHEVEGVLDLPQGSLEVNRVKDGDLIFEVSKDLGVDAEMVSKHALREADKILNRTRLTLEDAGVGDDRDKLSVTSESTSGRNGPKYFVLTFVLCGSIAGIVLAVIALYIVKRHSRSKEKLKALAAVGDGHEASKDYQDLCRQRMQSKTSDKGDAHQSGATRVSSVASESAVRSPSSRSSTSSWSEEPVASNMDISTGHIVLSYMEDHLKNKDRLSEEWEALCAYEAEPSTTTVGAESSNMRKNRYSDVLPYDHSRVILSSTPNVSGSDYINANTITDHDPRNPAYIATQGPLPHTVADFWQMVWEQGSVVIVCLTKLTENGVAMCHRYWPEEGSDLYHIYEVHLVSEHIWCDDYLVRSFYLKNLQTNETRTVTQFHFLTWPDLGIPTSAKALLDFRRKVNKSYRGRSCPIVVHCSDGVGRTGAYCLVDMVLNRMSKGAKEIDIAATLEHIRDQRANMVKTKEQFEFVLASVAEEVHAILKALPQ